MKRTLEKSGFTLIELLIVVAIIAILAAIAVPNFLEAQTRAKIARAQADMRTLATGVEAYAVDWNKPPIGPSHMTNAKCVGTVTPFAQFPNVKALAALTTPVAYLTSFVYDPFREKGDIQNQKYRNVTLFNYDTTYCPASPVPIPWARQAGFLWSAYSVGPSRNGDNAGIWNIVIGTVAWASSKSPPVTMFPYDATNGTISLGWIIRTNKGILKMPDSVT